MSRRYFDWTQEHGADELVPPLLWYLDIALKDQAEWDLRKGKYYENWDPNTAAFCDQEVEPTDFPVTSNGLPVYSPRLMGLVKREKVEEIQFLPVRIKQRQTDHEIVGYHIANYLTVLDCLDRDRSNYQVWTKENLLFWEKRPWMLGKFRDVQRPVLDVTKIGPAPIFRLWGWEAMVVIRDTVKEALEDAGITGCRFTELEIAA